MAFWKGSLYLRLFFSLLIISACTPSSEEQLRKGWWKKTVEDQGDLQLGDVFQFTSSYSIKKDTIFHFDNPIALFLIEERRISKDAILTLHSLDSKSWARYIRK